MMVGMMDELIMSMMARRISIKFLPQILPFFSSRRADRARSLYGNFFNDGRFGSGWLGMRERTLGATLFIKELSWESEFLIEVSTDCDIVEFEIQIQSFDPCHISLSFDMKTK